MKRHFSAFMFVAAVPLGFLAALPGAIPNAQGADLANPTGRVTITLDQGSALPSTARAIMKMSQGGVEKDVILAYIQSSALPYQLSAEGIIRLRSANVPGELVKAMIQRDGELQQQATEQYYRQQQRDDAMAMQKASMAMQFAAAPMMNRQMQGAQNTGDASPSYASDFGDFGYPGFGLGWPYFGDFGRFGAFGQSFNNGSRFGHEGRDGNGGFQNENGGFHEGQNNLLGGPGGFPQGGGLHGNGNSQPGNPGGGIGGHR